MDQLREDSNRQKASYQSEIQLYKTKYESIVEEKRTLEKTSVSYQEIYTKYDDLYHHYNYTLSRYMKLLIFRYVLICAEVDCLRMYLDKRNKEIEELRVK